MYTLMDLPLIKGEAYNDDCINTAFSKFSMPYVMMLRFKRCVTLKENIDLEEELSGWYNQLAPNDQKLVQRTQLT